MEKTKHAPGPWRAFETEDTRGKGWGVNGAGGLGVTSCHGTYAKANAALIVAAVNACFAINPDNPLAVAEALPKLVEALRESLSRLDDLNNHITMNEYNASYPAISKARAALAKLEED